MSPAPGREMLPGPGLLLPRGTVSSSAVAHFWPLLKLFEVIAVNFQNVWNSFLTEVGLSNGRNGGSQQALAVFEGLVVRALSLTLMADTRPPPDLSRGGRSFYPISNVWCCWRGTWSSLRAEGLRSVVRLPYIL